MLKSITPRFDFSRYIAILHIQINNEDSREWQLVSPSIALKEVMFPTAWVSDDSASKYQTRHVSDTPTNS